MEGEDKENDSNQGGQQKKRPTTEGSDGRPASKESLLEEPLPALPPPEEPLPELPPPEEPLPEKSPPEEPLPEKFHSDVPLPELPPPEEPLPEKSPPEEPPIEIFLSEKSPSKESPPEKSPLEETLPVESPPPPVPPEEPVSPEPEIFETPVKTPAESKSKTKSLSTEAKKTASMLKGILSRSRLSDRKVSVPSRGNGKTSTRKSSVEIVELDKEPLDLSKPSTVNARGNVGAAEAANDVERNTLPAAIETNPGGVAVYRATSATHNNVVFSGNNFPCAGGMLQKRSPFIHDPPQPEERRARIACPRTPKEYIINLREDLADFQESHGLPRTRDYSFLSLGLALAQETGRAIYSVFLMFTELFPILAIISLILRFALDKMIEILETPDTMPRIKKSIIFALEMLAIMIPLWILIGTIIIPLITLLFSIFKRMLRIKGGSKKGKPKVIKIKSESC